MSWTEPGEDLHYQPETPCRECPHPRSEHSARGSMCNHMIRHGFGYCRCTGFVPDPFADLLLANFTPSGNASKPSGSDAEPHS